MDIKMHCQKYTKITKKYIGRKCLCKDNYGFMENIYWFLTVSQWSFGAFKVFFMIFGAWYFHTFIVWKTEDIQKKENYTD